VVVLVCATVVLGIVNAATPGPTGEINRITLTAAAVAGLNLLWRLYVDHIRERAHAAENRDTRAAIQCTDDLARGRQPTEEEKGRFIGRLTPIPPQVVSVLYVQTDKEAGQFAQLTAELLCEAKWVVNGPIAVPRKKAGTKTGIACLTLKKYEKPAWLPALRAAFSEIGCTMEDGWDPDNIHDGAPEIYVGPRPQPAQTQTESKTQ
jgi:hypothetical protein